MTPKVYSKQRNFFSASINDINKTKDDCNQVNCLDKSFEVIDSKFKDLFDVKQQNKGFIKSLSIVNSLIKVLDRKPNENKEPTFVITSPWIASLSLSDKNIDK